MTYRSNKMTARKTGFPLLLALLFIAGTALSCGATVFVGALAEAVDADVTQGAVAVIFTDGVGGLAQAAGVAGLAVGAVGVNSTDVVTDRDIVAAAVYADAD